MSLICNLVGFIVIDRVLYENYAKKQGNKFELRTMRFYRLVEITQTLRNTYT